jgi:hypothetical protein
MDSPEECLNKTHFEQYPHTVTYQYNSRGFRDQEWPHSVEELKTAIWCVGDSFTLGLGSPLEHTWPWLLQQQTGLRTINISLDGASNNWIARKTTDILQKINPQHVVIHWSYLPRRELSLSEAFDKVWSNFYRNIRDPSWPQCDSVSEFDQLPGYIKEEINNVRGGIPVITDEDRRCQYHPYATDDDDLINTIDCINAVNRVSTGTKIIHSFIPNFCQQPQKIQQQLAQHQINFIPEFSKLDLARDGNHYDIKTSQMLVSQIINWMTDTRRQ